MSITQRCMICKEGRWSELVKDLATGLIFCKTCRAKIDEEYYSLIGTNNLAKRLRAIANVMERNRV